MLNTINISANYFLLIIINFDPPAFDYKGAVKYTIYQFITKFESNFGL
jgi:hypothetical protein